MMVKLAMCVFVLLLLTALGETRVKTPCCVTYQQDRIKFRFLKSYKVQEDTNGCDRRAIIFKTVQNRRFCGDPNKRWVIHGMEFVDKKQQKASTKYNNQLRDANNIYVFNI